MAGVSYRNTLDLDFNEKDRIGDIIKKLHRCQWISYLTYWFSPSANGYHVEFFCGKRCDLCRFVFDDQFRFAADLTRPVHSRNVLWSEKSYKKGQSILRMRADSLKRRAI